MSEKFNYVRLGTAIKAIREVRRYKQSYVAYALDIDQSVYSRIEKGNCAYTIEKFLAICEVLEISPLILLHVSGNEGVYPSPQNLVEEIKLIKEIKERIFPLEID